jgi:hypothetical protein
VGWFANSLLRLRRALASELILATSDTILTP